MQLEWVNHAAFVIHTGSTHLITDPWIEGTAFNNGWRLMSPTKFHYEDFSRITLSGFLTNILTTTSRPI